MGKHVQKLKHLHRNNSLVINGSYMCNICVTCFVMMSFCMKAYFIRKHVVFNNSIIKDL